MSEAFSTSKRKIFQPRILISHEVHDYKLLISFSHFNEKKTQSKNEIAKNKIIELILAVP